MVAYISLFANVSIPIIMACVLGYMYQAYKTPDSRVFADLSLYVLAPCLIVFSLATSPQQGDSFLRVVMYIALHSSSCWAASILLGRAFRLSPSSRRAIDLTTMFGNAVNYGLPLLLLAFGQAGFAIGVTYVVCQIVLVNTLGLYLASRSAFQPRQAVRQISRMPLLYASVIGIAILLFHIPLPVSLKGGLQLIGTSYPAIVLLILGMQLRKTSWKGSFRKEVVLAVGLRMLVVPLLAWMCVKIVGLHGMEAAVLFVQSSMPAAINALVLMEKYEGDTELVAITVAFTTVASFLYLPLLIHWATAF